MNDTKPSKSALKREVTALQELGEQLLELSDQQLSSIDTDPRLLEHVREARRIKSHSALRRQKQLIGKIMRGVDPEPIRQALARFGSDSKLANTVFRQAEHWRDRIAENGDSAVEEFSAATGCAGDTLHGCLQALHAAPDPRRRKHARRQLFRELHRLLQAKMQSTAV